MKIVLSIIVLLSSIFAPCLCQTEPALTTFSNISTDNGLPENKIQLLTLDQNHYLNIHLGRNRFVYDGCQIYESKLKPQINAQDYLKAEMQVPGTNQTVTGFVFQSQHKTFMLENQLIYQINLVANQLQKKALYEGIPLDKYRHYLSTGLFDEESGNFFFGSIISGLYRLQVHHFKNYRHQLPPNKPNLPSAFAEYYSQAEFENDKILINNYLIYDHGRVTALKPKSNPFHLDNPYIRAANLVDSYGRLWYSDGNYIFIYSNGKIKKLATDKDENIISITQAGDTNRFYAITRFSFFTIENDQISETVSRKQIGIPDDVEEQFLFFSKKEGKLYLLTTQKVYCINLLDKKCSEIQNLPIADYRNMSTLKNGLYFVGTNGNGYLITDGKRWVEMPLDARGFLKIAHVALVDQKGYVWISTNCGLFRARMQDLTDYFNKHTNTVFYYYYDKFSGFNNNEFNGGCQSPAIQLKNGKFSFSSMDGLVQFDPLNVPAYFPQYPITISRVEIDGRENDSLSDVLVLPAKTKELKISLSTPFYGHPNNFVLEYKLEDQGEIWKEVSNSRVITLQNMPSGTSDILVRVRTGFGPADFKYKILHITKLPHYYETNWFILSLVTLLILVIIGISKWHNRYTKQKNLELEYLISEKNASLQESNLVLSEKIKQNDLFQSVLAHDIKAPLRFIASNTKLLHDHWSLIDDSDKKQNLNYVIDSVTKMKSFVDETLLWIQIRNGELEAQKSNFLIYDVFAENLTLVETDRKVLQGTVSIGVDCDPSMDIYSDRILITTVVRNLVSNSIKHSNSGTITLFAKRLDQRQLVIGCADQGKGISMELKKLLLSDEYRGNSIRKDSFRLGYVIIKEIARLLGATLEIESSPAKGTAAYLILVD